MWGSSLFRSVTEIATLLFYLVIVDCVCEFPFFETKNKEDVHVHCIWIEDFKIMEGFVEGKEKLGAKIKSKRWDL